MKNIIVITGPTGVGKTKLSVELAKKLNAEIINGDAMQVYKNMNIGTAKIKEEEKDGIIHHLFDICDVDTNYTVYDYQKDCRNKIKEILNRGKKVIIVGGTGLYIKSALYNYEFTEGTTYNEYNNLSNEEIYNKIIDFNNNIKVHVNNRKRLVRILNKIDNNEELSLKKDDLLYDAYFIGLTTDRSNLYKIIDDRVDIMIKNGLLDEIELLKDKFDNSKALNTAIGYKEFIPYFKGEISLDEVINNIKKNSRHYAKRQYTFFNHQFDVKWFNTNYSDFLSTVDEVYKYIIEN